MILGKDVVAAVLEFFRKGKMIQGINETVITLIPKSTHADHVGDYRSIPCCNIIYKIISKIWLDSTKRTVLLRTAL